MADPAGLFEGLSGLMANLGARGYLNAVDIATSQTVLWMAFGPAVASILLYDSIREVVNALIALTTGRDQSGQSLTGFGYLWMIATVALELLPGESEEAVRSLARGASGARRHVSDIFKQARDLGAASAQRNRTPEPL